MVKKYSAVDLDPNSSAVMVGVYLIYYMVREEQGQRNALWYNLMQLVFVCKSFAPRVMEDIRLKSKLVSSRLKKYK